MKSIFRYFVFIILTGLLGVSCQQKEPTINSPGPEVIEFRVLPFAMSDVKLLEGPYLHATELNIQSLLSYEPDRFLARFREQAGLPPKAEQYYGWEAQSLAGHSLGHYLTACALMFQTTGNEEFLKRVNYIVEELAICQKANGGGYIGAFSRGDIKDQDIGMLQSESSSSQRGQWAFENEVAKGIIVSAPFSLNGIWPPFYTQHKILAGLRDAFLLCDNQQALEVKTAFADWLYGILAHLPHETIQQMLICEYGGINEVFADLYGMTGDARHLELSRIFHDDIVLDPITNGIDKLQGLHANTQIPKVTGLARRYELTGDENDRGAAEFFWHTVVHNHSYATGGNCNEEYFGAPGHLRDRLGPNTTESCNVYNMLRLTRHLFQWDAKPESADYYERALINHIRSSQHPLDGRVIYNLNIDMGGRKQFQNPYGFTCCVGTGMENHSKYNEAIYFHNDNELYISQFIASELNWKEKNLKVRQTTFFPEEESTSITFENENPVSLTLKIRYPQWAQNDFEVFINGKLQKISESPGEFISIKRTWQNDDKLVVNFPFSLRLEAMPDDEKRVSVFYGPVLLAGILGPEDDPGIIDPHYVPVIISDEKDPKNWITPSTGKHHFSISAGYPRNVELVPFFSVYDKRYTVFWDMMTEPELQQKLLLEKQKAEYASSLDENSIDLVRPGQPDEEIRWNLKGVSTSLRSYKERICREAERGGWFSYDLKVSENEPTSLIVEYWGGFEGSRTFDIIVEGTLIATENISSKKDGHFIKEKYDLPLELTREKSTITILFSPHDFNRAGPIFGLQTIQQKNLITEMLY